MWHLEDDENDQLFFARAVRSLGLQVQLTTFDSPAPAISRIEAITQPRMELPHLIVSDLKMPGMTGIEFVQWLRRTQYRCVPVVIFSGSALAPDILCAHRMGASSMITKPVDAEGLKETLSTLLLYWDRICQSPVDHWDAETCR